MAIYENLAEFVGRPVESWEATRGIPDPRGKACRVSVSYDEGEKGISLVDKLAELLADPKASQLEALVIGAWQDVAGGESSAPVVEALAAARDRLRNRPL